MATFPLPSPRAGAIVSFPPSPPSAADSQALRNARLAAGILETKVKLAIPIAASLAAVGHNLPSDNILQVAKSVAVIGSAILAIWVIVELASVAFAQSSSSNAMKDHLARRFSVFHTSSRIAAGTSLFMGGCAAVVAFISICSIPFSLFDETSALTVCRESAIAASITVPYGIALRMIARKTASANSNRGSH